MNSQELLKHYNKREEESRAALLAAFNAAMAPAGARIEAGERIGTARIIDNETGEILGEIK